MLWSLWTTFCTLNVLKLKPNFKDSFTICIFCCLHQNIITNPFQGPAEQTAYSPVPPLKSHQISAEFSWSYLC